MTEQRYLLNQGQLAQIITACAAHRYGLGANAAIYLSIGSSHIVALGNGHGGSDSAFFVHKIVQAPPDGIDLTRMPHNIKREVLLLSRAVHPNVRIPDHSISS
jgi:hypothetical protein